MRPSIDYETMLSELVHIFENGTTSSTSVIANGTSTTGWKRTVGKEDNPQISYPNWIPKDYLWPMFVMADSNYCN